MFICDPNSLIRAQEYVKHLSRCLSSYSWLHDSFVLEFFTENHWKKLPISWQEVLDNVEFSKLAEFLSASQPLTWKRNERVWPLSLQSLRAATRAYSLNRQPPDDTKLISEYIETIRKNPNEATELTTGHWKSVAEELSSKDEGHQREVKLKQSFHRRIKPKKEHEIARMAQVVDMVASVCGSRFVVDVGSGRGHLSRLLTFGFDFSVVSIEAEGSHVLGAQTIDSKVVSDVLKKSSSYEYNRLNDRSSFDDNPISMPVTPRHLVYKIDSNVTGKEFVKVLSKVCNFENSSSVPGFILVGLHTCGNLAPTMLKVYAECSEAVALVSVACCYMKLDSSLQFESDGQQCGYPLSDYVSSDSKCRLSYEAKEVACHAIEHYLQRLKYDSETLRIHCYRATLETLITKHYPHLKRTGLCSVKITTGMPFNDYAILALRKTDIEIPEADLLSIEVESCMSQWRRIIVFYSLRLMIAPVVETLILLDRLLFLWERGFPSFVCAIFDPNVSPRNHIILSLKMGKK